LRYLIKRTDIGYVKKTEAESYALFEFIVYRYERKSLIVTANQSFSGGDQIFTGQWRPLTG